MAHHDIVVIGASAGGVEALSRFVQPLPADLPAAIFVVLHIPAQSPSLMHTILSRNGPLRAVVASDGLAIEPGKIYVAQADHHLLLEQGWMRVVRGPRENLHRPAIDTLFRSAARAYGPRVVGVVLSGALDDGTAGLLAIKRQGGLAVVQDPADAMYPSMPMSAIANVAVDHQLPLSELPAKVIHLIHTPVPDTNPVPVPREMEMEVKIVEMDPAAELNDDRAGEPSAFSCPECGGVLYEIHDDQLTRFRCRVGHAYSSDSMFAEHTEAVEDALWTALNTLEESGHLSRRMAKQAEERGHTHLAERYNRKAQECDHRALILRQVLLKNVEQLNDAPGSNGSGTLEQPAGL